jgi:hypothetical protein
MIKSIKPFIGAKDYIKSQEFYREMGFEATILSHNLIVFELEEFAFYLQDAYVEDWINNSMVFLEVEDINTFHNTLSKKDLPTKFEGVRLSEIKLMPWGKVCYLHDPSGILWHIGTFQ